MREKKKHLHFLSVSVSPQAQEQLEEVKLEAVQDNNVELVTEILGDISGLKVKDDSAAELSRILKEPHFQVSKSEQAIWLLDGSFLLVEIKTFLDNVQMKLMLF